MYRKIFHTSLLFIVLTGLFISAPPTPAHAISIVVTNTNDASAGSLRQALADATDGDTIDLTGITGTITLTTGTLIVADNVTITGPGPSSLTIDGNNATSVIGIQASKTVTISGLTVTGGSAASVGGGINNSGDLTLDNMIISANQSADQGGGIYSGSNTSLTIQNSEISGNTATSSGGGIHFTGTSLNLDHVLVDDNHATGPASAGGGVAINVGATVDMNYVTISNNSSASTGGGLESFSALTMTDSTVNGNSTAGTGGGIKFTGSSITLTRVAINDNHSTGSTGTSYGGGISIGTTTSSANFYDTSITNNSSNDHGGGLASGSSLTFWGGLVANNSTTGSLNVGDGGGLYLAGSSKSYSLYNVTVSGNTVDNTNNNAAGGGIYNLQTLNMHSVTIAGNTSEGVGGGLGSTGTTSIKSSILAGNTSTGATSDDCSGTISSGGYNLIQVTTGCTIGGTTTGNVTGQDPLLNSLADNGGPTMTRSLQPGSPAIDTGDPDNNTCPATDQRGVVRPQDGNNDTISRCDMGAFEVTTFPTVLSITRASANPTSTSTVDFTVTFSANMNTVDISDFDLTVTGGITAAFITAVNGTVYTNTRTVTVNTGSGNGTIRLDLIDDNSIVDSDSNMLGGLAEGDGDFTTGEVYTVNKERLTNGGFNLFSGKIPTGWAASKFDATDGKTTTKHEGSGAIKIVGTAVTKKLKQTVNISGAAGEPFNFSLWIKGNQLPTKKPCQVQLKFYNGTTKVGSKTIKCATGTYNWQQKTLSFNSPAAYTKVVVTFTFSKASGTVYFDGVSLLR